MQLRQRQRGCGHGIDREGNAWIIVAEFLDHWRQDCIRDRGGAPDAYGPLCRIGKGFDVPDALSQLIKGSEPAFEQRTTIDRWHRPPRTPVKQAYAKCILQ